jgi:hypothetical protein
LAGRYASRTNARCPFNVDAIGADTELTMSRRVPSGGGCNTNEVNNAKAVVPNFVRALLDVAMAMRGDASTPSPHPPTITDTKIKKIYDARNKITRDQDF